MICDAVQQNEIFEAYLLYASLHGLNTDEDALRLRVDRYVNNDPDSEIDDAILAFAEDRIIAPPDVVLKRWGKSRIYELFRTAHGEWRHQVCDSWFDNGCQFFNDVQDPKLAHFWTNFLLDGKLSSFDLNRGSRLSFRLIDGDVLVEHRLHGPLGRLDATLAAELQNRDSLKIRYLPLVDGFEREANEECGTSASNETEADPVRIKLLVTLAHPDVGLEEVVAYATQAFAAVRRKC